MSPLQFTLFACFLVALAGLAFLRVHLLSALLCLEALMMTLYVSITLYILDQNCMSACVSSLVVLTISACEASIGLALLVATSRTHASDKVQALNLLQC